jgi:hypothetical protein
MKNKETFTAIEKRRQLRTLATLPDDQIDTSDIPELTADQIRGAVRRYPREDGTRKPPVQTNTK